MKKQERKKRNKQVESRREKKKLENEEQKRKIAPKSCETKMFEGRDTNPLKKHYGT